MKFINYRPIAACLFLLLPYSCKKTVIKEVCKKRIVKSVTILQLPDGIDTFSNPDLKCNLSPSNSDYYAYSSNTIDNVSSLPITITFQNDILMSKESWNIQLLDEDLVGIQEIYLTSFNPYEGESDGSIKFTKDEEIVMKLNYTEHE